MRLEMSDKFPRMPHFPFSPGAASDDRINDYWTKILLEKVVITEKLDGENTCLNKQGVYSRSHSAPTRNPWADYLKPKWAAIKNSLGNLEVFGENLFAVHSIEYTCLEHYFYVFAVRESGRWLCWEEVNEYAQLLDFPVVPLVQSGKKPGKKFKEYIIEEGAKPSLLGGEREGLVVRVQREFDNKEFSDCMLKWVRPDHVKTTKHWAKNWKQARLKNQNI